MTKLCLLAGNYLEAQTWARSQMLDDASWFFPIDEDDLKRRSNFYPLVVGSAGLNIPASYFERILRVAHERGRLGRSCV